MQSQFVPEERRRRVELAGLQHGRGQDRRRTVTSRLLFEGGYSRNLEYYTYSYQDGIGQPRWSACVVRQRGARSSSTWAASKTASVYEATRSPARQAVNGSASYVTGSHNIKVGAQMTWGTFMNTLDSNAHLLQNYRSNTTGIPFTVPDTVTVSNYPVAYGNRLNHDVGIYAQDSWTLKRLTINAGLRYENLQAQVLDGRFRPGTVRARAFVRSGRKPAELEQRCAAIRRRLRPVRQREDGAQVHR